MSLFDFLKKKTPVGVANDNNVLDCRKQTTFSKNVLPTRSTTTTISCEKNSLVAEFWTAFASEESAWQSLTLRENFDAINTLASKYYPSHIAFEISGPENNGIRNLCISANGMVDDFPVVMGLLNQAPSLQYYKIYSFRKRVTDTSFTMEMGDFSLSAADILIGHYPDGAQIGLEIRFARDIPSGYENHAHEMTFIMLDHIIGEYDFSIKVGGVNFVATWSEAIRSTISLDKFPTVFDFFWAHELGHTALFSPEEHTWKGVDITFNTNSAEGEAGETAMVLVNNSANALAMRADLSLSMTLIMPVCDKETLYFAQEKQEKIGYILEQTRNGIVAYTMLKNGYRQAIYYVGDGVAARKLVEQTIPPDTFELHDEYDFRWKKYCRFID